MPRKVNDTSLWMPNFGHRILPSNDNLLKTCEITDYLTIIIPPTPKSKLATKVSYANLLIRSTLIQTATHTQGMMMILFGHPVS